MARKLILVPILFLLGAAFLTPADAYRAQEGPAIKSVHVLNLPDNAREIDLVNMNADLNRVIADLGFPGSGYKLWRVSGEGATDYSYMWEGSWPSSAAYEEIQGSQQYMDAMEEARAILDAIREDQRYTRYVEVTEGMASAG